MRTTLSAAERALWDAYPHGALVDLCPDAVRPGDGPPGSGPPDDGPPDDPATFDGWDDSRVIRAEIIGEMLLGGRAPAPGRVPALRLRGARITGLLDLSHGRISAPILLRHCVFESAPVLADAATQTVRLSGCRLPGLDARRVRTDGVLALHGNQFTDFVRLADARIDGSLTLTASRFTGTRGRALEAHRITVEGNLEAFRIVVDGEMGLNDARITGILHFGGAQLRNPGGLALGGGGLTITGGVFCTEEFTAQGQVRLVGARLGANLTFRDATLRHFDGVALLLDRAVIGTFKAQQGFTCEGEIRMVGAQVAGQVDLSGARLDGGASGHALTADGASVGDAVLLNRVHARGSVRLRMARITGRLHLWEARLDNPGGIAFRASRSVIGSDVFAGGLQARGEVRFSGAQIGARLHLSEVRLHNPGGPALSANPLAVTQLELLPAEPVQGHVDLRHAQIGVLRDDPLRWPAQSRLDGLTYQALEPRLPARDRLRWLASDSDGYQPQPYEQLAAEYSRVGQHSDARRVLHARERRQRAGLTPVGRAWNLLQDVTVAYGYQPWRAAVWLLLLLGIGSAVYGADPPPPLKAHEAPHFNSVIYTLDLLLPLVDLGQEHAYNPAGALQWFSYVLIAAGWVLATTIAAGVARVLTRR